MESFRPLMAAVATTASYKMGKTLKPMEALRSDRHKLDEYLTGLRERG